MSDRIESIFMSMSEQNKKALVKNHVGWASEQGVCEQCTYPWHDGLCDCGHGEENKENNDLIATLAHSLIKDGHNLDDCHGCMCEEDY